MNNDTKGPFKRILVIAIILLNVLFTAAVLVVFWHTAVEPTTLVISWFGFTTGELGLLAWIKNSKSKKKKGEKKNGSNTKTRQNEN